MEALDKPHDENYPRNDNQEPVVQNLITVGDEHYHSINNSTIELTVRYKSGVQPSTQIGSQ